MSDTQKQSTAGSNEFGVAALLAQAIGSGDPEYTTLLYRLVTAINSADVPSISRAASALVQRAERQIVLDAISAKQNRRSGHSAKE